MVRGSYLQLWWPSFNEPVYVDRLPVWADGDYVDPVTGEILPTWADARDRLGRDPEATPAHVMGLGRQLDLAGIIAPSVDADRAVRYLTKYLTKSIAGTHLDPGRTGRMSTGCTPSSAGSRAHRAVRTGCATASNPPAACRARAWLLRRTRS